MKMDKKISAALIAMLFVLGIVAVPVSAHFTMGNHLPAYPFRSQHFDPHQMGPLGYVFPGGGLFSAGAPGWYTGTGTYPGYQSPWPYWTSGVNNPFPSQGPMGWYQLDANNYAPFGAILTSTITAGTPFTTMWKAYQAKSPGGASDNPTIETLAIEHAVKGDLILAFNVTASWKSEMVLRAPDPLAVNFTRIEIWIPPEFTNINRQNIVPSWTNNYDLISLSKRSAEDPTGPFWTRLRIYTDTAPFGSGDQRTYDKMDDAPDSWLDQGVVDDGPFKFSPWKTFGNITFGLRSAGQPNVYPDEWYYIRINDVVAPTIAGTYHFKFTGLSAVDRSLFGTGKPWAGMNVFPTANYPVVLVKGEVDPGIITGTIRYGGWNSTLYGKNIEAPGRVRAVGIADDPYTLKSTGRPVEARGYFDAKWKGHYEVEGVAAGVYDIYASAAGYPELKIASNVKLLKGQSYHIDGYLIPGVQIRGTIFSKCGTGEVPWFGYKWENNIKIEIYRTLEDAQSMLPGGSTFKAATWSPIGDGAASWIGAYSFPWGNWANSIGQTSPTISSSLEPTTTRANANPRGVGPAQNWYVGYDGSTTSFTFQFGREGAYGAPSDLTGHIPGFDEVSEIAGWTYIKPWYNATWASGIGAGTYVTRAWLFGYVQTQMDGITFNPVTFTVPSIEWHGNVYLPFDLYRSSEVKKTVHFHNVPGTLQEDRIGWGWSNEHILQGGTDVHGFLVAGQFYRFLTVELVGTASSNYKNPASEMVHAFDMVPVNVANSQASLLVRGFRELGLSYGWGRNYGIPSGLYTVKGYMWGYVEQVFEKVNIGMCGTTTVISDHLYRGANFNISVYSKDWQHPTADKSWSFPYQPIYVQIMKDGQLLMPLYYQQFVMPVTMQGYGNTSVAMWPYMWNNPYFMIRTHDSAAQVFGPDPGYDCIYGPESATYYQNYFGPSSMHGAASGYQFRLYDGSENINHMFSNSYFSSAGIGAAMGSYPYSFESGIYEFRGLTYGYVNKKSVMVYATKGNATSDILIKLTQGAELQLNIRLKHEGVFEKLPFDAHLRVRVLDDKNNLVGEYLTSDWWWQPQFEAGQPITATTTTNNYTRYAWNLVQAFPSALGAVDTKFAWGHGFSSYTPGTSAASGNGHRNVWRVNYVPKGTEVVKVVIAGLPDMYGWAYGVPCDPCLATGPMGYSYMPPDAAPYGIDANPNYMGGWKIQVHVVPIPPQPPVTPYSAFNGYIGNDQYAYGYLMGELTYTADMKPVYTNHPGPYELRYDVVVPGTHLGGESSLVFELDRLGLITGSVYGYTYCDDWRTVAWTNILFTAADGTVFNHYTFDGWFGAWMKPGPYTASVVYWTPTKGEGYKVQTMPYHVSDGASGVFNVYLEQSQVPIPEFPVAAIVLASALAASLFILRRKRK
jgi:hypothetical protein